MWPSRDSSANSIRLKSASSVFASAAKAVRTNSSKAAASPSSARQNPPTCLRPRARRARPASSVFPPSSFSSFAAEPLIQGGGAVGFFAASWAMAVDMETERITAKRRCLFMNDRPFSSFQVGGRIGFQKSLLRHRFLDLVNVGGDESRQHVSRLLVDDDDVLEADVDLLLGHAQRR